MSASSFHVIVGMGVTGLSCARYLHEQGTAFAMMDTRPQPPQLDMFYQQYPGVPVFLGGLNESILAQAESIILSPGIAASEPAILAQAHRGVPVVGDIELFAKAVTVPIIAITGTNAKSTVTTLVGKMAEAAGYKVKVGGNLGIPALDLIDSSGQTNLYVLELSSFQLETTYSLQAKVATVLNISPDHMDRYKSLLDYQRAKHRVYHHCQLAVCNRDDPMTETEIAPKLKFTLQTPGKNEFGLIIKNGETYLAYESEILLSTRELPVVGKHYQANALAALAIGHGFGLPIEVMLNVLQEFTGLPHRCQFVRNLDGVNWYNDSKGTNVGATLAAIEGLGSVVDGKLILIAGGLGKNADFNPLVPYLLKYVRHVVLIGQAAHDIAKVIGESVPSSLAKSMEDAIYLARQKAIREDSVLLSPACASQDMFKHFEHRGEVFTEIVKKL